MSTGPVISCLALLRVGVTEPPGSPRTLVRSYRTVSPLPVLRRKRHSHRRSVLCCPNRQVTPSWLSPAPCPLESRLSSTPGPPEKTDAAATQPAHRRHQRTPADDVRALRRRLSVAMHERHPAVDQGV